MPIRPDSPPFGFSTLTTSAPIQASASVQVVPASNCVRSRTLTPARQFGGAVFPSIFATPPAKQRSVQAFLLHDPLHRRTRHHPVVMCGDVGRQFHGEPLCGPKFDVEQRRIGGGQLRLAQQYLFPLRRLRSPRHTLLPFAGLRPSTPP